MVLAYALDRLSRDQNHVGILLDEWKRNGVRMELVTERFEDTPVGRFLIGAQAFAAELERAKMTERTRRGVGARVQGGNLLPGSRPRYGFQWGGESKSKYLHNKDTASIVRRIFSEAATGTALRDIARGLDEDGIETPTRSDLWSRRTILNILRCEMYIGRGAAFRQERVKTGRGTETTQERPASEQHQYPEGTIPALVDVDTFERVQRKLDTNKLLSVRSSKHPEQFLLRGGFLRCGHCGSSMTTRTPGNGKAPFYRCSEAAPDARKCVGARVNAATIDCQVYREIVALRNDPERVIAELERLEGDSGDYYSDQVGVIDSQVGDIDRKRRNLVANLAELDADSAALVREELAELSERRQALMASRVGYADQEQAQQASIEGIRQVKAIFQHILDAWEAGDDVGPFWDEGMRYFNVSQALSHPTYQQMRDTLTALGLTVKVWKASPEPRIEIDASIEVRGDLLRNSSEALWRAVSSTHEAVPSGHEVGCSAQGSLHYRCTARAWGTSIWHAGRAATRTVAPMVPAARP